MAGRLRFWPEGCAIGCGVLAIIVIVVGAVGWLGMMQLSGKAMESRAALEEAYPAQSAYTPPLDGAIAPDRMERFLAVRDALMPWCEAFTSYRTVFLRMEEYEQSDEEPPAGEFAKDTGSIPKTLWRLGRDVHRFAAERNEALLAQEMGLGEYTWIYVTAYFGWLGREPAPFVVSGKDAPRIYEDRVRGEVMGMMRRYVAGLDSVLSATPGSVSPDAAANLALWRGELVAMENDPERRPFQDGLPPALASSYVPYRTRLEELFCPATCEMEFSRTVKSGLWYDHR